MAEIIHAGSHLKRAAKFIRKHSEITGQYKKTLQLRYVFESMVHAETEEDIKKPPPWGLTAEEITK